MPVDYRRFNAPEDSVPYNQYIKNNLKSFETLCEELVNKKGRRKDGRLLNESGPMSAKLDMISQAKGSSYVEMKNTKVICSVFDPREIPHQNEFSQLGQLYCEVKFAPFSCPRQRRQHVPDAEERALSITLRQALEPAVCRQTFPNYQVDVFVYILENGGACLPAAINAAGLALAHAAVPMYDIITASSVAVFQDKIFVDPTEEEEYLAITGTDNSNHGIVTMTTMIALNQISDYIQIGSMDVECVGKATDALMNECEKLAPLIQKCLIQNVKDNYKDNKKFNDETMLMDKILDMKLDEWAKNISCENEIS